MKEKLIELFGLSKEATEDQIVETAANLKEALAEKLKNSELEKAIRAKIAESGGALNRENAILTLTHQKQEDAKSKK